MLNKIPISKVGVVMNSDIIPGFAVIVFYTVDGAMYRQHIVANRVAGFIEIPGPIEVLYLSDALEVRFGGEAFYAFLFSPEDILCGAFSDLTKKLRERFPLTDDVHARYEIASFCMDTQLIERSESDLLNGVSAEIKDRISFIHYQAPAVVEKKEKVSRFSPDWYISGSRNNKISKAFERIRTLAGYIADSRTHLFHVDPSIFSNQLTNDAPSLDDARRHYGISPQSILSKISTQGDLVAYDEAALGALGEKAQRSISACDSLLRRTRVADAYSIIVELKHSVGDAKVWPLIVSRGFSSEEAQSIIEISTGSHALVDVIDNICDHKVFARSVSKGIQLTSLKGAILGDCRISSSHRGLGGRHYLHFDHGVTCAPSDSASLPVDEYVHVVPDKSRHASRDMMKARNVEEGWVFTCATIAIGASQKASVNSQAVVEPVQLLLHDWEEAFLFKHYIKNIASFRPDLDLITYFCGMLSPDAPSAVPALTSVSKFSEQVAMRREQLRAKNTQLNSLRILISEAASKRTLKWAAGSKRSAV